MVTNVLEVNPERLWDSLEKSAKIGRFRDVGLRRPNHAAEPNGIRDHSNRQGHGFQPPFWWRGAMQVAH